MDREKLTNETTRGPIYGHKDKVTNESQGSMGIKSRRAVEGENTLSTMSVDVSPVALSQSEEKIVPKRTPSGEEEEGERECGDARGL